MSEDLKKMKVTIEGDAKSLKKELGSARAEVKKVTDVFKNAFKLDESQALRSVRSTMQKVKAVVSSVTPKLGFKGKMQEFQIKAGIKVPTEEFQNVENSMDKLQQKVNALLQDEQALSEMGKNQGMSDKYRNLYQSAKEAENALDKLKRKQQELNESGNGTEFTAKYQNAYEQMMNERDRLTSLQKEKNARMAKKLSLSDVTQDGKMINLDEKIAKTQKNIENLAKSMQSLESKGKMEQPTQAAKKLAKQIQAAEDKLGRYKTKMSELTAAGTAYGSDEWIKNQREIQKCTVEMEKLSRVKANLLNSKEAGQRPISLKSCYRRRGYQGLRRCHQRCWLWHEITGIRCNPEVFWCVQCPDPEIFIRDPNFEKSEVFFQWSWNIRKRPGRNTENSWYDCKIHVCKFCNSWSN